MAREVQVHPVERQNTTINHSDILKHCKRNLYWIKPLNIMLIMEQGLLIQKKNITVTVSSMTMERVRMSSEQYI